ncbi:hypothetical protein GCM10011428_62170 [Streptomyces violaceus]
MADAAVTDHHDLATLVDLAIEAGFRPEWTETASLDEWEEFESAYLADVEVWLAEHPGTRSRPRPGSVPTGTAPGG